MKLPITALLGMSMLFAVACSNDDDTGDGATEPAEEATTVAADPTETTEPTEEAEPTATPEPTATATPEAAGADRSNPAPISTEAQVGNWMIVVNSVTPDATDDVLAENQFNDPPAEGNQFFIANVSATYLGGDEDSATFFADLSVSALGPSAVAYQDFSARCGVIPDEMDTFSDVFEGGTIGGNICWQIAADDASDLLMFVEESFSFEDEVRVWFALY